jgi:hypothetical protein
MLTYNPFEMNQPNDKMRSSTPKAIRFQNGQSSRSLNTTNLNNQSESASHFRLGGGKHHKLFGETLSAVDSKVQ